MAARADASDDAWTRLGRRDAASLGTPALRASSAPRIRVG